MSKKLALGRADVFEGEGDLQKNTAVVAVKDIIGVVQPEKFKWRNAMCFPFLKDGVVSNKLIKLK